MKISIGLLAFSGVVHSQMNVAGGYDDGTDWMETPGKEEPPRTMARYPAIYRSVAPRDEPPTSTVDAQVPFNTSIPEPEGLQDVVLTASLENCLSRNRAQKCDGLDKDIFVQRARKFLSYWRTEDWEHDTTDYTDYDLLVRLVEYQDVHQAMVTESKRCPFADNTVDLIRSARNRAMEAGALKSANARILDALDVIYDDICVDTKKTKVPPRVQEITDIVLRGLSVNAEKTPFTTVPQPCVCGGHFPCGMIAQQYWHAESGIWVCDCLRKDPCEDI